MSLEPGEVLAGRYRIGEPLGRGGMAEVFAARDEARDRDVAIKVMDALGDDPDHLAARLEREAQHAAQIDSPFVCKLLSTGRDGDGALFLVLERLHGETLEQRLARTGALPLAGVATIVDQVLEGLSAAHASTIVHRDLKPSNVFLAREGGRELAKIMDFGVSRRLPAPDAGEWAEPVLTAEQSVLGSIAYMAPEQGESAAVDARADLYALGVTTFRALSGRLPFDAQSPEALLALKLDHDAPTLDEVTGVAWPEGVRAFCATLLMRDPARRFPSADVARAALRSAMQAAAGWIDPSLTPATLGHAGVSTETLRRPPRGKR